MSQEQILLLILTGVIILACLLDIFYSVRAWLMGWTAGTIHEAGSNSETKIFKSRITGAYGMFYRKKR